jgi:hypothetical protein
LNDQLEAQQPIVEERHFLYMILLPAVALRERLRNRHIISTLLFVTAHLFFERLFKIKAKL